jgi:hypothetical protein
MIFENLVAEADVERHNRDAGGLLEPYAEVGGGIRNDPHHASSIASARRRITAAQRERFVRLDAAKIDKPVSAVSLPTGTSLAPRLTQAFILTGFLGFQALDSLTTHLGLALQHPELNRIMAPVISMRGELAAYAVKGLAVAVLLAILMLMQRRKPSVWHAYHVAAWLTAAGVVANVSQLL